MANLPQFLNRARIKPLDITLEDPRLPGSMVIDHRDPVDRLIVAQSRLRSVPIITNDRTIAQHHHKIIWS